jgi:hypothetical protein
MGELGSWRAVTQNRLDVITPFPGRQIVGNIQSDSPMYYRDPDGNRVELQIDNFSTAEEGQAWMRSPAFDQNPIGLEYDPDELVRKFQSGVPVAELVARD